MRTFDSIGQFIQYLRVLEVTAPIAVQHALRDSGRMVQEEAQSEIGHYQDAAGPFPAWPALADSTLNGWTDSHHVHHPGKIELGFAPPDNPLLRSGELRHAIELSYDAVRAVIGVPDMEVGDGSPGNLVRNIGDIAIDHECGTRNMPARPFLGRALYVRSHDVINHISYAVARALAGLPYDPPHKNASAAHEDIPF